MLSATASAARITSHTAAMMAIVASTLRITASWRNSSSANG
ncbi:hypothetical protein [Nocardia cyriacigeorgica]